VWFGSFGQNSDTGAIGCKAFGNSQTDTTTATRDDGAFTFERDHE
jgi:hypothetical protein